VEVGSSCKWRLLAWQVRIGHTFDVHDERYAGEYPLVWVELRLQLGREHVASAAIDSHVDWALVSALVLLALWYEWHGAAVDDWQDAEGLLGEGLFELSDCWIPSRTLDLEAEHVGTLLHWW